MADRRKWDPDNAGDSDKLMVLSWNGGNLDRPCNNDTLLKVLTDNQHVSILQEGWSQRLDQWLYTHAMKSSISCCSSLRVARGGSGLKGIVYTYDSSSYVEFNCVRRNTTNRKTPHAFFWFTWDIAWFHPVTHQLLSRGHHNHYRVTSIHYNNDSAKKPDSVYALLYDLMILAIRDNHDYVACDMNQATAKFKEVLTNIAPRYPEIFFSTYLQHQ